MLPGSDGHLIARLARLTSPDDRVELAVRNILGRAPTDEERQALREYLEERTDRPEAACRQLVWALLTSPEFRFNH